MLCCWPNTPELLALVRGNRHLISSESSCNRRCPASSKKHLLHCLPCRDPCYWDVWKLITWWYTHPWHEPLQITTEEDCTHRQAGYACVCLFISSDYHVGHESCPLSSRVPSCQPVKYCVLKAMCSHRSHSVSTLDRWYPSLPAQAWVFYELSSLQFHWTGCWKHL